MVHTEPIIVDPEEFEKSLRDHCSINDISIESKTIQYGIQYKVCDRRDSVNLNLFMKAGKTSKVVFQSPNSKLQDQLREFVSALARAKPTGMDAIKENCCAKYSVQDAILRDKIKELFSSLCSTSEQTTTEYEQYSLVLSDGSDRVRLRQFKNGTLIIQGLKCGLWDRICTTVEEHAGASVSEIATRFISKSEAEVDQFVAIVSPKLVENGENRAKEFLKDAYNSLSEWDKKYIVSSLCLLESKLSLPEYSCMVMPAAKGFEGFVKQLAVEMNWVGKREVEAKGWNFGEIWDRQNGRFKNQKVQDYVSKVKHRDKYIDKLRNQMDFNRNFMMHSDSSQVTKVENLENAQKIVTNILETVLESFKYFIQRVQ